jgi:hypothetical protein
VDAPPGGAYLVFLLQNGPGNEILELSYFHTRFSLILKIGPLFQIGSDLRPLNQTGAAGGDRLSVCVEKS